jgi:IclR family transcriptional regulator, KDG regulon repressor
MDNKANAVQSIVRAANILTTIGNGSHTITEIADKCGLSNSTVHRLLQALVESHMVIQDSVGHKYFIGDLITRLIYEPQVSHEYLIMSARDEMARLADNTGETVFLMVMTGQYFLLLYEVPSKHNLRVVGTGASSLHPILVAGAVGKILFSQLDNRTFEASLRYIVNKGKAEEGLPDKQKLKRQIRQIRKCGFAVSSDNIIAGAMSLAAPVINYVLPAVLSIMGPKERLKPQCKACLEQLVKSAESISNQIGNKMSALQK